MKKKFLVYLVSSIAFLGPFAQTIYTPLLPELQEQFRASPTIVNMTVAIYPIFFALMQLVYGPLIDRYGRRKILLIGVLFYLLATLGISFSSSIQWFIFYRALQACGIAVGSVAAITVIGDVFEGRMRGRSMGIYQMLVALGPGVAPIVGGIMGQHFGTAPIAWILFGFGLLLWFLLFQFLPETKKAGQTDERFRFGQLTKVLTDRVGLAIVILGSVQYAIFYTLLILLPTILSDHFDLSSSQIGMLFLPISFSLVLASFIGGRIQEYVELRRLLLITGVLNMTSILFFTLVSSISLPMFTVSIILFGLSLGLSLPVQTTLLANELPQYLATSIGVYNFFRYVWMTIGPAIGTFFYYAGYQLVFYVAVIIFACALIYIYTQLFSNKHVEKECV